MKPRVILVTDPAYDDDVIVRVIEAVARVLPAGSFAVQLRDKVRAPEIVRLFATRLRIVTSNVGVALVVNGDTDLARDIGADGVHLGGSAVSIAEARRRCGHRAWISVAAHSDDAVRAAVAEGADAALVSPIFPTASDTPVALSEVRVRIDRALAEIEHKAPHLRYAERKIPRGVGAIESACEIARPNEAGSKLGLYALGGVNASNARACVEAGADGVALIRALLASEDPAGEAKALYAELQIE